MQSGCLEPGLGLQLQPFERKEWGQKKERLQNFTIFSKKIFSYFLHPLLFQGNDTAFLHVKMDCKNIYLKYRSCVIPWLVIETTKHVGGRNRDRIIISPVPQEKNHNNKSLPAAWDRPLGKVLTCWTIMHTKGKKVLSCFLLPDQSLLLTFLKLILLTVNCWKSAIYFSLISVSVLSRCT